MAQDWDIKSRGSQCGACERPFEDGESYHTALTFDDQGYRRHDYCGECWRAKGEPISAYSTWQGTFQRPPAKPPDPVQKANAETLLRRLVETGDPKDVNVIYILAVMLERKRILVERDVKVREETTLRIYEQRKTGESFVVTDPRLRLDELEHVQQEVVDMLEGGQHDRDNEPAAKDNRGKEETS